MRTNIFTLLLICYAPYIMAQTATEPVDTVKHIDHPHNVLITRDGNSTTVLVNGAGEDSRYNYIYTTSDESDKSGNDDNWNVNFPFTQNKTRSNAKELVCFNNLYTGILFPVAAPGSMCTSWEIGIGQLIGIRYIPRNTRISFSAGIGFAYRQWSVGNGQQLIKNGQRLLTVPDNESQKDISSRLKSWYIQIPLLYTQKLWKNWGFSAGAILDFNVHTKATTAYTIDDIRYKESYSGLHQRFFSVDMIAILGLVDEIGLYVRYSPMTTMENGYGPQFKNISFGLSVGF